MTSEKSTVLDSVEFVVRDACGKIKQSGFVTYKAGRTWEFRGNRLYNALLNADKRAPRLPLIMGIWRLQ